MLPITTEIARAEALHGPLPLHVPPSDLLLHLASVMEAAARSEQPMSPLAILCEEVCEAARATPDELPAELVQIIAVCLRWRRALGHTDDVRELQMEIAAEECAPEVGADLGYVPLHGTYHRALPDGGIEVERWDELDGARQWRAIRHIRGEKVPPWKPIYGPMARDVMRAANDLEAKKTHAALDVGRTGT